jgi:hypothetical protein
MLAKSVFRNLLHAYATGVAPGLSSTEVVELDVVFDFLPFCLDLEVEEDSDVVMVTVGASVIV